MQGGSWAAILKFSVDTADTALKDAYDISSAAVEPSLYGGFLSHSATSSHHPLLDGIFHYSPTIQRIAGTP